MKKMTKSELESAFWEWNKRHNNGEGPDYLYGVIVYSEDNWKKKYPLASRSYKVSSGNRAYQADKIANSVFGSSLDGSDIGVRLDWYKWKVDYCYLLDRDEEDVA